MVRVRALVFVSLAACGGAAVNPDATSETTSAGDGETTSTGETTTPTGGGTTSDETTSDEMTHGEPVCCGCLCIDPRWSCAADTCVYADGTAVGLAPEAGFLALAPHTFSTFIGQQETVHAAPEARMWYAFRPADEAPEDRPLAVFFNGGPGYSSATLFGLNTNAVTLDPDVAGAEVVVDNPHGWTRFANVLYIDPRNSGYSYDVAPRGAEPERLKFAPEHDAADYVRTILAFLARHPAIRGNPVILASESYGGNATQLVSMFLMDWLSRMRFRRIWPTC